MHRYSVESQISFYGYFTPGIQLESSLVVLILFPSSDVLFMNFYPFKKSLLNQGFYIICWSIFCLLFEYASIASGYFYHNNWNYWYSAFSYPLLFLIHLFHLKFFRTYSK
ncbi:CBO0543 family protein [Metabacillus fastidiosus]|uniref:CBO0543 family protein n=1 Tax=Metabacillus fastidiosus TaxID=1458 RepID=UPI003D2A8681